MTKYARYVIILDREIGDSDGQTEPRFHDGTGKDACRQVADELQEAIEISGSLDGFFNVVGRTLHDDDQAFNCVPPHEFPVEDDPSVVVTEGQIIE